MRSEVAEVRTKIAARKEAARQRRRELRKRDALGRAVAAFSRKWERDYDLKHGR